MQRMDSNWKWSECLAAMTIVVFLIAMFIAGWQYGHASARDESKAQLTEMEEVIAEQAQELNAVDGLDENGVRLDRMREFYGGHEPDMLPKVKDDAEFKEYCQENLPEAVYPSTEWTVDGIIASWLEQPEIWGCFTDDYYMTEHYLTWTPDYKYCFILDADRPIVLIDEASGKHKELESGWLIINGVRAKMLDTKTYEVDDPYELVRQYQAGEWDGSLRRSSDGATEVDVDRWYGTLNYTFKAWRYDETTDPENLAYTGFECQPWWKKEGLAPELAMHLSTKERAPLIWQEGSTHAMAWLDLGIYVDAPIGRYDTKIVLSTAYCDDGTFFVTKNGVELMRRGEPVSEKWEYELEKDEYSLLMRFSEPSAEYAADMAYLYDEREHKMFALRPNGEMTPALDCVVDADLRFRNYWGWRFGQERSSGTELVCFSGSGHYFSTKLPLVLATNVIEVDFSELPLFTKSNGTYVVVSDRESDDRYKTVYLGKESMEYYKGQLEVLKNAQYVL